MEPRGQSLTAKERKRFEGRGDLALLHPIKIQALADFVAATDIGGHYWYRGHADVSWRLAPSALRYEETEKITAAVAVISDFKRVAEFKLSRPPDGNDQLRWAQLAQHYGLPTRLLDWTESPLIALYFACLDEHVDGTVFMLNPADLNRASSLRTPRVLDMHDDSATIRRYLTLSGAPRSRSSMRTLAIRPVWNSERIIAQKGVFTLHGTMSDLDLEQAPSLVAIPVLSENKSKLRIALEGFGIDEMTLFPEIEHACSHLKRRAGL